MNVEIVLGLSRPSTSGFALALVGSKKLVKPGLTSTRLVMTLEAQASKKTDLRLVLDLEEK